MIIEFGNLNYKLLIPLLYPIFRQIKKLIHENGDKDEATSSLYNYFLKSISYLSAGLVYLLILYRSNKLKQLTVLRNSEGKPSAII